MMKISSFSSCSAFFANPYADLCGNVFFIMRIGKRSAYSSKSVRSGIRRYDRRYGDEKNRLQEG
ncbi:hypothetical protein KKG56_04510 [bacterium]|nr:hypothetical protein [bacterium]